MIPLFERYPLLRERLPYVALGEFPTPIEKLERLGDELGMGSLYLKNDGMSARIYGGNKIRKLEFLLGHARTARATEVLTFGYAGSNHALATAICAEQLGVRTIAMLLPQPNARYVRRNLLMAHRCGSELHAQPNIPALSAATLFQLCRHRAATGRVPEVIAAGGSSARGTVGYVNAGLELERHVAAGELAEPDAIYVAAGSMGTAVGLMIGLRVAGLGTRVVPVRVTDVRFVNARRMVKLFRNTTTLLHSLDPSFPALELSDTDVHIREEFFGDGYAAFTESGVEAMARIRATEALSLEGTYTGKALAALIHDVRTGELQDETVVFWNTYNGRDFSSRIQGIDYHELPRPFHRYFEEPVQALDGGA